MPGSGQSILNMELSCRGEKKKKRRMTTYKAHEFGERHVEGWCDRGGYKKQEAEEERKDKEVKLKKVHKCLQLYRNKQPLMSGTSC